MQLQARLAEREAQVERLAVLGRDIDPLAVPFFAAKAVVFFRGKIAEAKKRLSRGTKPTPKRRKPTKKQTDALLRSIEAGTNRVHQRLNAGRAMMLCCAPNSAISARLANST